MSDFCWLLPSVTVVRQGAGLKVSDLENSVRASSDADAIQACLLAMDGSRPLRELRNSFPAARQVLRRLQQRGWVVLLSRSLEEVVGDAPERSRQLSYFAHLQPDRPDRACDELARKTALVVGVGGVGSQVATILAGSGVGRIILNDPDTVESSNLNRQFMYTLADVGKRKVDVLADALHNRFPKLSIEKMTANLDEDVTAAIPDVDAIVVCGECASLWDRPQLVGDTPLLMAGYFGRTAVVGPCVAPKNGGTCWACMMRHYGRASIARTESRAVQRPKAWNPSGAGINGIAGSLLGEAVVRVLAPSLGHPLLMNQRLEVDTAFLSAQRITLKPRRTPGGPCFCRPNPGRSTKRSPRGVLKAPGSSA